MVPRLSHDIYLNADQIVSTFPTLARITLSVTDDLAPAPSECHVVLEFKYNMYERIITLPPSINQLNITKDQRQMGIMNILKMGKRTHYAMQYKSDKKITWLEAQTTCSKTLDAESLLYFSQAELKEIYQVLEMKPNIIFTAFHRNIKVRGYFYNNLSVSVLYLVTSKKYIYYQKLSPKLLSERVNNQFN